MPFIVYAAQLLDLNRVMSNVVMFQCVVLFLVALFFWKVYNSLIVAWQNRHRETGTPSENYDEETWFGKNRMNEGRQLFPKGNCHAHYNLLKPKLL